MLQNFDFIVGYGLRNGKNLVFQYLKRQTAYYGRSLKPQKTWFCGYETVTAEKVEIVRRLPNPVPVPVRVTGKKVLNFNNNFHFSIYLQNDLQDGRSGAENHQLILN